MQIPWKTTESSKKVLIHLRLQAGTFSSLRCRIIPVHPDLTNEKACLISRYRDDTCNWSLWCALLQISSVKCWVLPSLGEHYLDNRSVKCHRFVDFTLGTGQSYFRWSFHSVMLIIQILPPVQIIKFMWRNCLHMS